MGNNAAGMTVLEIILVIVLIGIFSMVVLVRTETSDVGLPSHAEILKSHLRYAQSRAMDSDTAWGIQYDGSAYRLFNSDDPVVNRSLPGWESTTLDLSSEGISIQGGGFLVSFDSWGRPCGDNAGQNPLPRDLVLTLQKDTESRSVTITRNTGFIP